MSGAPKDYVEVSERIAEFRAAYPDGSLQSEIVPSPVDGFIAVKAYAYRTSDDPMPGTGLAWEPVPGKTNFTRDSELMNCETSAWGRALIAVGAADAKRGIASANEVRNRQTPAPVDLSVLHELVGGAKARGIEGDYDGLLSAAGQSQGRADKAVAKLRAAIATHDASGGGAVGEDPPPSEDTPGGGPA